MKIGGRTPQAERELVFKDQQELDRWTKAFRQQLGEKALILLVGPMAVGKTRWVRVLTEAPESASPSFALHHHYTTPFGTVDHVDLYRLESAEDLESMGFWDLLSQDTGWIVVEWGDRLPADQIPEDWPLFVLEFAAEPLHLRLTEYAVAPHLF